MAEVLVIGGGGREAAIAQAMEQSSEVSRVEVHSDVVYGLHRFSGIEKPFVIIGPEAPLVYGLADNLRDEGYIVLGAGAEAAQYEASKSRAVKLARRVAATHPATFIAEGPWMPEVARAYTEGMDPDDYVIKADGLNNGKAVELPETKLEAQQIVERMIRGGKHGYDGAGRDIINFAKRKHGSELTPTFLVGQGKHDLLMLPIIQDHKREGEGDAGKNTGGIGAYGPVPDNIVSRALRDNLEAKAYYYLGGMEAEGVLYEHAVLSLDEMVSDDLAPDDSDTLEINVRFTDPQTQALFPLLQYAGVDSYRLLRSAAEGSIEMPDIDLDNLNFSALSVCLAARDYPREVRTGDIIYGAERSYDGVSIQLAGVSRDSDGNLITDGGRVLYVTGVGEDIDEAARYAYAAIGEHAIHFAGYHYRRDIGHEARSGWDSSPR